MRNSTKIRRGLDAVFFDFDGVILESVALKTEAFIDLFAHRPEHRDAIVKLHVENGGMSRFEKFRIIHSDFFQQPYGPSVEAELAGRFSELVFRKALACPFVPGAREFLEAWSASIPFYVVSGTPTEELRAIVAGRGLDRHFRGVYGSPEKKAAWTARLIAENRFEPAQCRFVGDAGADLAAAREAGVPFIGRRAPGADYDPFSGEAGFPVISDLFGLEEALGLSSEK